MSYSQNFGFGSGVMFATPSTAGATPIRFGVLQDATIDFSFTTKQLFGGYQFPVSIGRGTAKVSGKAKFARIDAQALTTLFFNLTPGSGNQIIVVDAEAGVVPSPSGPYTVTVTHSSAWESDQGVNYATTGQPLTKVGSSPTAGQYSVSAGVYTFGSADAGAAVLISYGYTATTGSTTTITNPILGTATPFQIDFYQKDPNSTQQWGLRLYACLSTKLNLVTKMEDFTIPEFDFEAYANASNNIGTLNLPNS